MGDIQVSGTGAGLDGVYSYISGEGDGRLWRRDNGPSRYEIYKSGGYWYIHSSYDEMGEGDYMMHFDECRGSGSDPWTATWETSWGYYEGNQGTVPTVTAVTPSATPTGTPTEGAGTGAGMGGYQVSGAGTAAVNGVYTPNGNTHNGEPVYAYANGDTTYYLYYRSTMTTNMPGRLIIVLPTVEGCFTAITNATHHWHLD